MTQTTVGRMHNAIGSHTRAEAARPNRQPLPFHPRAIFYVALSSINFEPAARVAFVLIFLTRLLTRPEIYHNTLDLNQKLRVFSLLQRGAFVCVLIKQTLCVSNPELPF